jgi:hypothetical protein
VETVYDWVTVAVFAGLAVLLLQRSSEEKPRDRLIHYLPPAAGCGISNYLGNEGLAIPAVAILVGVMAYIYFVLKPFERSNETSD